MATPKGGKKGRKFGRWNRGSSMATYVAVDRLSINRQKRAEKHRKRIEKQQTRAK